MTILIPEGGTGWKDSFPFKQFNLLPQNAECILDIHHPETIYVKCGCDVLRPLQDYLNCQAA